MFNLEQSIGEWRGQMAAAGVKTAEALDELEAHLRDGVDHGIGSGQSAEQAFTEAVRRLGGGEELRGEFAKEVSAGYRALIYRVLVFGIGAFLLGAAFCYFAMVPVALAVSQAYSRWLGFSATRLATHEYVSFVAKFMLGTGLGFGMPVVILTLVKSGVVNYRFLTKARKYVIIVNLVLGAILTTPEVITQLVLFLPLQILYEISVGVAWYWGRNQKTEAGVNVG
jgi:hypothetical protein